MMRNIFLSMVVCQIVCQISEATQNVGQSKPVATQNPVENGASVNYQSEIDDGWTALLDDFVFLQQTLDQDRDVNTALLDASKNGYIEIVKRLLENGADVNHQDGYGLTALMYASKNGHIEVVRLLLENGAKVDIQSTRGRTALMYASWGGHIGHIEIVRALLAAGANYVKIPLKESAK